MICDHLGPCPASLKPSHCVSIVGVDERADSGCVWALLWTAPDVLGMACAALPCAQQDPCTCGKAVREALPGAQGWTCLLTAPLGLEVGSAGAFGHLHKTDSNGQSLGINLGYWPRMQQHLRDNSEGQAMNPSHC